MKASPLGPLTLKAALGVGFGLTLGVWLLAGYQFSRRIADVQRDAAAINARYIQAQERLSTIRNQVLLGSVYVRDALLDPDEAAAPGYSRRLEEAYRTIETALSGYVPVLDAAVERERMERIRLEVADFRATMLTVLGTKGARGPQARVVLQQQIVPKREAAIRSSEELRSLNRDAFVKQQLSVAAVYRDLQRHVWTMLGFALAGSLGIGLIATQYAGRLEARLRGQLQRDAETALDLQRLSAKLVTVQEEERRAIARELHDEVGQLLTALKVELALAQRAPTDVHRGRALDEVRGLADIAQQTVRDLSHLLHPALLDDLGLPAAVDWYLKGVAKRSSIRTELCRDNVEARLPRTIEAAAYRIIQEAVTNVVHHAGAEVCLVTLRRLANTLQLLVEDDGKGFDADAPRAPGESGGLGLISVRERVAQCGGSLTVISTPGHGTRIAVELPLTGEGKTLAQAVTAGSFPQSEVERV